MFEAAFKLFVLYGWPGIAVAFALFVLFKIVVNKRWSSNEDQPEVDGELTHVKSFGDLKHHSLFSHIKYAMNVEVPSLDIYATKPVRQELLRDLTYITLKTILEMSEEIALMDYSKWTAAQWNHEMQLHINNLPIKFTQKASGASIPKEVVVKYFKWYVERLDSIREFVDQIAASYVYKNNAMKTHGFFMVLHLFSVTLVADAERTLRQLNGDLTGKIYKNREIEGCDVPHTE